MSENDLGVPERAALLALMAAGREVSNPELAEITGFSLTGEARRRLNDRHLVTSWKQGRAYAHELTDKGWKWCTDELGAACPPKAGSAGGALYAVLHGLRRYLERADLRPADVFGPGQPEPAVPETPASAADLAAQVRAAYRRLASGPGGWVGLAQLRPLLGGAPRDEVDLTLRRMTRAGQVNLVPQANQKVLTPADRDAAVRIGNEDNHLISIEEGP